MKFFLDTANLDEIRDAASFGVLDGVTTNPSLVSKEGEQKGFKDLVREICEIVKGPVSAEVLSTDIERMIDEARELAEIHEHVVVKMPLTEDGVKATKIVSDEGINVNVTLIFSPSQALMAAKAGAAYVSPFVGRLDDISEFGMEMVGDISADIRQLQYKDGSARSEREASAPRSRGRQNGGGYCDHALQGVQAAPETPSHGYRTRKVFSRLGKGQVARRAHI